MFKFNYISLKTIKKKLMNQSIYFRIPSSYLLVYKELYYKKSLLLLILL